MDIQRQTPAKKWYRAYWLPLVVATFACSVLAYSLNGESTSYHASAQHLSIGEVIQGDFSVNVRGTGILRPMHVRWLSASVGGRVEEITVKPGAFVKEGDVIVQMSNPELTQRADETAWELEALSAENKALRVTLESGILDQQAAVLKAQMNYESAKISLDAQDVLLKDGHGTVSRIDHQRSMLETQQFLARWNIEKQRLEKLKETKQAQLEASQARYTRLSKSLARAQQQIDALAVRASLDGVLQALPLELGEQVNIGDNIAKVARQDALIAQLQISERQVNGVAIGQTVLVDTRRSTINGVVSRIDPAVQNGVVHVDVIFNQALPEEARPDLTVDGTINIASINSAMYVGRPTFAQSNATSSVYRLTEDGKFAERVSVSFGTGSAGQIQVLRGLAPGQRIILSDSSAWDHLDRISIQ